MAKRKRFFKKYTAEEKFRYHRKLDSAPGPNGLKYGGAKHCYSAGFVEAFHGTNNASAIGFEFGKRSGKAYELGYKRGRKAAGEYFMSTGKQPSDLDRK